MNAGVPLESSVLPAHIVHYAADGALLGAFMLVACATTTVVCHPRSPLAARLRRPVLRRFVIGVIMGLTAVTLITSPPGRLSGAHMNPAVTAAFTALGKVRPADAIGYIAAQFVGGAAGVWIAGVLLRGATAHAGVRHAVTQPGVRGVRAAWWGEFTIAFVMMLTVLVTSNSGALARYTPWVAGCLVVLAITFEAPLSGMSMNPARTLASALAAREFRGLWVYFTAPPLAMLMAAGLFAWAMGLDHVRCAKLDHSGASACIFRCGYATETNPRPAADIPHGSTP
jgi:aquaporin Z